MNGDVVEQCLWFACSIDYLLAELEMPPEHWGDSVKWGVSYDDPSVLRAVYDAYVTELGEEFACFVDGKYIGNIWHANHRCAMRHLVRVFTGGRHYAIVNTRVLPDLGSPSGSVQ